MVRKSHGKTSSGKPITEDLVTELRRKAEAGFDPDAVVRRRGGRPPMGTAAATVESVRLDPELREALAERARRDHESTSSVIREALRRYLNVA
jgi:predicted HicB family RNase H-like nuclease